ncbi:hypothetical protein F4775DRAFT_593638 [Biscogniauxia sp. FL1348]|nr:hypothetical protein F4775DRAFT_593638 [Biscogniauxia sp. FL1348]
MRFLSIITSLLAAAPAVLAQFDGNYRCMYGTRDDYPDGSQPDGREARRLRRCFEALAFQWETGARCRDWWITSHGHRWNKPHHCWKACYKCIDGGIGNRQPEVYCDKYKVSARCIMSYRPWLRKDPNDDDYTAGLRAGNATSAEQEEEEEFPDMYNPAWDDELDEYDDKFDDDE